MTETDIREWKRAKRRKELRKAGAEGHTDYLLLAEMEEYYREAFRALKAGDATLQDLDQYMEKWERGRTK